MGRHQRGLLTVGALALSLALVGCETSDMIDKLTDMIPFGDNKKPLPGERKEVFPGGVPGVPQGVPPDMVKGNEPPPDATAPPQQAAVPPPAEKPKPKKKAVAKPKPPPQPAPDQSAATVPPTQPSTWPPPMQPASGWPSQPPPPAPAKQ
jgi:hypothetical protein